jgi:hypothetical protein
MLKYFLANSNIEQVGAVRYLLNQKKKRMENGDYTEAFREYDECKSLFEIILEESKQRNDECLANSQLIFQQYFLLFCNLGMYFTMLQNKEYKNSWSKLQDCFDISKHIGQYTEIENRLEIPEIVRLLIGYESLYPYTIFVSSEFVITKSHCSICGKSMQSLDCPHLRENLYWGKVATSVVDEIKTFQAVCVVSHPEDKRCVMELSDDMRSEQEKFIKLDQFLELHLPFLQIFSVEKRTEYRMQDDVKIVGRNQPCPCGSGLKFKKCCGKDLYYQYERNIVRPLNTVKFIEI